MVNDNNPSTFSMQEMAERLVEKGIETKDDVMAELMTMDNDEYQQLVHLHHARNGGKDGGRGNRGGKRDGIINGGSISTTRPTNDAAEELKVEGNELVQNKKYTQAIKKYKKAVSIDPTNVVYFSNIAYCYDMMKDLNAFKKAAQKCVNVDPAFIKGYYRLGKAQSMLWEFDEAKITCAAGLTIDPYNLEVRQLQKHNEDLMSGRTGRDKLHKDTLSKSATNLQFLGGGTQFNNPPDSAYSRLTRSPFPPVPKKYKDLSQYSEHIRPAFDAFYNDELQIEWALINVDNSRNLPPPLRLSGNNAHVQNGYLLLINGYVQGESAPVIAYHGLMQDDPARDAVSGYSSVLVTIQNVKYDTLLTRDQKDDFSFFMLRRFLREKAALINRDEEGGDNGFSLEKMFSNITEELHNARKYTEACDVYLAFTDVALNQGWDDGAIIAARFCEALECAKRYKEAADIYVEISDWPVFSRHPNCRESVTRNFAGLAYKRAMDYISAEREYVASLRAVGSKWNLNPDSEAYNNVTNMMIFYETVHLAILAGVNVDEAHLQIQRAYFVLAGLLSINGFDGCGKNWLSYQDQRAYQNLIKPQYRSSRKKALRAIVAATMCSSIDDYHKVLFSYHSPYELRCPVNPEAPEEAEARFLEDQKTRSKYARKPAAIIGRKQENIGLASRKHSCSNCHQDFEDMKSCPCRIVEYCSQDCQISHWKTHKKMCPLHNKR